MEESEQTFTSPEAALHHYRNLAKTLQTQLEDANSDIQDFTESSKELQDELESELLRMEKGERELRRELEEIRGESGDWKSKYTNSLSEHASTVNHLQKELESSRASTKMLNIKLRDMELDNDNLEKSEREKDSSLKDWKLDLESRLERIAFLEEELLNKTQLEEEIQRLKDELRDAVEEIAVLKLHSRSTFRPPPRKNFPPTSIDFNPDNLLSTSIRPRSPPLLPSLSPPPQTHQSPCIYQPIMGSGTLSRSARLKELTLRLESRRNLTLIASSGSLPAPRSSTSSSSVGYNSISRPPRPTSIIGAPPNHTQGSNGMNSNSNQPPTSATAAAVLPEIRTSSRPSSRASMLRPPSRQFAAPVYDFSNGLSNSQKSQPLIPVASKK